MNIRFYLARIIHERFCCNRRSAATTSLRPAGSPLGTTTYCTSTHRILTAPRGKERGSGVFLAGVYTAICLSDIPALLLFRGQKTGTFCFSLQQDRGVRACSPTSMGERCAAVYRGVLTSCLASLERTVPYRRPRGAWRTVTSTSCPNKDRK